MDHDDRPRDLPALQRLMRELTQARIGLARAGPALATRELLAFQRAHAQARDAVHTALDARSLLAGAVDLGLDAIALHSRARDRTAYLARPDLGRSLDDVSVDRLHAGAHPGSLAIVIADGLAAAAVHANALALLRNVVPLLRSDGWRLAPLSIVEQGRVAIGDEIAQRLGAQLVVVLIGERPGLSATDSLGAYLTFNPHSGCTDAERNCISNIRTAGLSCEDAAHRIAHLSAAMRRCGYSGMMLKDETVANDRLIPFAPPANVESTSVKVDRPLM
jgi:ethanolamine ammonia-lyase small subunit